MPFVPNVAAAKLTMLTLSQGDCVSLDSFRSSCETLGWSVRAKGARRFIGQLGADEILHLKC
jgi:hypothetical protein